jgi:hypothetical protein
VQAEYEAEGIDWSYIEFVDNQDVLDLIEGKLGVVDLLDEQCRFPTATYKVGICQGFVSLLFCFLGGMWVEEGWSRGGQGLARELGWLGCVFFIKVLVCKDYLARYVGARVAVCSQCCSSGASAPGCFVKRPF